MTNLFGQHVSPRVVDQLLAIGAAELSEMRRVCVMFVDIRSFTAAARSRTPAEVVERLDAVFEILVDAVDRHNGIVNKFPATACSPSSARRSTILSRPRTPSKRRARC